MVKPMTENNQLDSIIVLEKRITELQATNLKLLEALKEAECPNNADLDYSCGDECGWCANRSALIGEVEG